MAFIALGLPDPLLGSAWSVMFPQFAVSLGAAAYIGTVVSAGTLCSVLLADRFVRRFGTGRIVACGVLLLTAATFGFSIAWHYAMLLVCAGLLGAAAGAIDVAVNRYVSLHYEARHMSWLHCFWGVGAFLGPIIMSGYLGPTQNWRGGYRAVAFILLGMAAVLFISLPLWRRREKQNPPGADAIDGPTRPETRSTGALLRIPGVKPAMLTFLFYTGMEATFALWGASYLVSHKALGEAEAAAGAGLFFLGITLGRLGSGFLTMLLAPKTLIRLGWCVFVLGAASLFLPLPALALQILFLVCGLGCAPIYPNSVHETPRRFGEGPARKIIGFQIAASYFASLILPPVFGTITNRFGMGFFVGYVLVFAVLFAVCSERVMRVTPDSSCRR